MRRRDEHDKVELNVKLWQNVLKCKNVSGHLRAFSLLHSYPASDPISLPFLRRARISDADNEGHSFSAASAAFLEEVSNIA